MSEKSTPKPYDQWSTDGADRKEDAAYMFGYYLIKHCRAEALKCVESAPVLMTRKGFQKQVEAAVDIALHNVLDLIEGYWPVEASPQHPAEFQLSVRVRDTNRKEVECLDISSIDMPIGYWKWKGGEFR